MAGIPVRVDWTVLVIGGLLAISLATGVLPDLAPGFHDLAYWGAALALTGAFFGSLLGHELCHSVVARGVGIEVRDITLWLFGGVAAIEGEPKRPRDELLISLAGPAASFTFALASLVIAIALDSIGGSPLLVASAVWLATVNVVLAVFNLAPAAPLDGGRVLRAFLWHRRGDRTSAAISAARAGRVFAWVLIVTGVAEVLFGLPSGLWLVLLGWFLLSAAGAEETQVTVARDLRDVRVADVMTRDPVTIEADRTVADAIVDLLDRRFSTFPVTGRDGDLVGLVTLAGLKSVPPERRSWTPISDAAWPVDRLTIASPDEPLLAVLARLDDGGDGRVLVLREGRLVGIVSPSDVARAVRLAELERAA